LEIRFEPQMHLSTPKSELEPQMNADERRFRKKLLFCLRFYFVFFVTFVF